MLKGKKEKTVALAFEKIRRESVTNTIIEQIKTKILSGELQPGQQLPPERVLAESLSVSRTSVREALKALQYIGLLEIRCGEGTFLAENVSLLTDYFKAQNILKKYPVIELIEARKVIESETVVLATKRSLPEEKEGLQKIFEDSQVLTGDVEAFLKADFDFHRQIAEMSHNSVLLEMLTAMRELTVSENIDVVKKPGQIEKAIDFHEQILHCILFCDHEQAHATMLSHLQDIEGRIKELCEVNGRC